MSNNPKTDLIEAILALDSYNRGYGVGVNGLADQGAHATIGNYSIVQNISQNGWQDAGFYAIAYSKAGTNGAPGETVIAYRGTDSLTGAAPFIGNPGGGANDVTNGYGLALGSTTSPQTLLAEAF